MLASLVFSVPSQAAQRGEPAPALTDPGGKENVLTDSSSQITYVDFWASWCGPCRRALPALERLHSQYAERGVRIIAVNVDEQRSDMDAFLQQYPISYENIFDPKAINADRWRVNTMPTAYLLDANGNILDVKYAFRKSDEAKLAEVFEKLLANKEPSE